MTTLSIEEYTPTRVQVGGKTSPELTVFECFVVRMLVSIQKDMGEIKAKLAEASSACPACGRTDYHDDGCYFGPGPAFRRERQ